MKAAIPRKLNLLKWRKKKTKDKELFIEKEKNNLEPKTQLIEQKVDYVEAELQVLQKRFSKIKLTKKDESI